MGKLKNKVAVVTGASKGIGAAIATYFAAEGAKVVVNYAITISLSKEFSGRKIRINSLLPGSVETEGTHSAGVAGSDYGL